ncbi:MAG: hypothetical protein KDB21_02540 [Acidimicrobiales bacterium]|nr:hypothetical protein [Acidimicrobiales bacterium]
MAVSIEIKVISSESHAHASAESDEGRQVRQYGILGSIACAMAMTVSIDGLAFGTALDGGALDPAGVVAMESIVDCGGQDLASSQGFLSR